MENHQTLFPGSSNWPAHSFPPNMVNFHGANIYGSAVGFDVSLENMEKNQGKKVKRRLESIDLRFKQGAMLIFLMMGIDGGNMGRKQSRTTSFPENFGL